MTFQYSRNPTTSPAPQTGTLQESELPGRLTDRITEAENRINQATMKAICGLLDDVQKYCREHSLTDNDKVRMGRFIGAARAESLRRGDRTERLNNYMSLTE